MEFFFYFGFFVVVCGVFLVCVGGGVFVCGVGGVVECRVLNCFGDDGV